MEECVTPQQGRVIALQGGLDQPVRQVTMQKIAHCLRFLIGVKTAPSTDESATTDRQTTSAGDEPTNASSTDGSSTSTLPDYAIAVLILGLCFVLLVGVTLLLAVIGAWINGTKKKGRIAPQELNLTEIADPTLEKVRFQGTFS